MSTAHEIMSRQLEDQAKQLNEYRLRAGPPLPKLENIKPRQQVSGQELDSLREAQLAGKYNNFGGLREVICADMSGRPITYHFGNPNACFDQVSMPFKYVRGFKTASR